MGQREDYIGRYKQAGATTSADIERYLAATIDQLSNWIAGPACRKWPAATAAGEVASKKCTSNIVLDNAVPTTKCTAVHR